MKFAGFASLPTKVLLQVLNFQETSAPLFWVCVVIVFICSALLHGFPRGVRAPCADRIGNLERIALHLTMMGVEPQVDESDGNVLRTIFIHKILPSRTFFIL